MKKLPKKKKLSKKEEDWLIELETLLKNPPSKRLGFYTTGDTLEVYDYRFEKEINKRLDSFEALDFCGAVDDLGIHLFSVDSRQSVHSTAG